jgi:diguanylate cyclase (GGDEF)-like protein/PAS domain S-box-containing protein
LISLAIIKGEINDSLKEELLKTYTKQKVNFDYFHSHSSVNILNIYNRQSVPKVTKEIEQIKQNLYNSKNIKNISIENWWKISTIKIDALDDALTDILKELKQISKLTQREAYVSKNLSLFYLFISFSTLISLLFVLRKIIFQERKSVEKIEKQKKVYELLNETNKYLLKKDNKKDLYTEIHNLISKNPSMIFSFIYDLEEDNHKKRIYAQEGNIKNYLISKLEENKNENKDNLLTKAINSETNVIVESFENINISIFSQTASKFEIKSAAAFPVKKFNKVVSVLLIYSKENNFFDYEIEILFNKMIVDMNHSLEKFDYEEFRIKQENQLRVSSVAFESSEPMLITDRKAQIVMVNHAFCDVMKYKREMLLGRNPRIFRSLYHSREFYISMWDKISKSGSWKGEIYNTTGKGETISVLLTITAIKDSNGDITNYLAQYLDITEQKNKEKALEYQATHDNLTGLPNRLLLFDRIEHTMAKIVRHKFVAGLIFIDLDNFKEVNDTLGHDIGDALLIMVAKKIKEVTREEDTIARIGGDEFIVLIDNIGNDKSDARTNIASLAEKIKIALNSITHIEGYINISTPSIGVTLFNDSSVSVKDIIKQADTAMYVAKKQGKNSIEFFD